MDDYDNTISIFIHVTEITLFHINAMSAEEILSNIDIANFPKVPGKYFLTIRFMNLQISKYYTDS